MAHVTALRAKRVIRDHVNKYIAHLDLDLLAGAVDPPDGVEILDFEDALSVMRELTTGIGARFVPNAVILEFETGADLVADQAARLVATLRDGLGRHSSS